MATKPRKKAPAAAQTLDSAEAPADEDIPASPVPLAETAAPAKPADADREPWGPCIHIKSHLIHELHLSAKERVDLLDRDGWIDYPFALDVFEMVERWMTGPKRLRPHSRLIIARPNSGKSALGHQLAERHPYIEDPEQETTVMPLVRIEAPSSANDKAMYQALLTKLYGRFNENESTHRLLARLADALIKMGTRVLVIDEFHHMLTGTAREQHKVLNGLKHISNMCGISILGLGTAQAAAAVHIDTQWKSRFKALPMPLWTANRETRSFLRSLEQNLPLKHPSNLWSKELCSRIVNLTGGALGEMVDLLSEAAMYAVKTGSESIGVDEITHCGYTSMGQSEAAWNTSAL